MSAVAAAEVPRGKAPRPVTVLDDVLLELIDIGDNVRVDTGDLDELAASIAELGVLDPVKVTAQPDGRYRLVWGQRRVLASIAAGQKRIPALIEPASDIDVKGGRRSIEQLSENLQRKDLNPIEEAIAIRDVLDGDPKLTQAELAQRLGRSAPWISNTLRLLQTDPVVQDGIRAGTISASHGKSLAALPAEDQRELAKRIANGLTSNKLDYELQWRAESAKQKEATRARTEKAVPKVLELLAAADLPKGTRVAFSPPYNLEGAPIHAAIKKAGYPLEREYAWERTEASKCDCPVVKLEFYRTWKLTPACVDAKHRDRQGNADHLRWKKEQEEENRRRKEREELIAAGLTDLPSTLLHVLSWSVESWHREDWPTHVAHSDEDHVRQIAEAVGLRTRDVDHATLLATLQQAFSAKAFNLELAKKPPENELKAKSRPAGGADAPPFTPAQLAAARAELDLDGD